MNCAKAGLDEFRTQLEYEPESPEPLINGDLSIAATKSAEIFHGGSLLVSLGLCKNWDQFLIQIEYKPEKLESLINGGLGIATTKSAEIWHDGSLLGSLELC